ncbi:hypothetical protein [Parvularcula dongshanensis]|uniref:VPLPA-CTERM sorting domain-containing protein n=1 Tax=Parvularcula dongshanensis TaxID=1173995 RepID=A0A840I0Q5_9PROT|nr:hypothetical protein [Parvularcula dongshanensis]MBB4658646.1 hypothetical protein [Parvularcula dongshanensis]
MTAPAASAAAFTLDFGANSTSSNSPLTGAAASVDFDFTDEGDDVRVTLVITNTTGQSTFGAGATMATLTGFGFDLVEGATYANDFTNTGALDTYLADAAFQPFGTLDVAFADNNNFNGGNANDGLMTGLSTTVTFLLASDEDAAGLMSLFSAAFFEDGLQAGVRFQQVNAGAGSDKLVFNPANPVPLPGAALFMLTAIGGGALARRKSS